MDSTQDTCILVFVRCPTPGRVKTRLAAGVGPQAACDFYRACASYTLQLTSRCMDASLAIHYSAGDNESDIREWVGSLGLQDAKLKPQIQDPCLGAKMRHALECELVELGVGKALVVGSDIPGLSTEVLSAAMKALDTYEVVLGPAVDGGYYLLGVKGPNVEPRLFEGIEWSTPSVLSRTLEQASAAGLRVAPQSTLPVLQDIDTVDDLRAWRSQCRDTEGSVAPETAYARRTLYQTIDNVLSGI